MAVTKAPFVELMALEAVGNGKDSTFMSKMPAWVPAGPATYGGHVYAQAVWAACQTVEDGFVVHNVHGYFTLPGLADRPFIYIVTPISDGRSYLTRSVTVQYHEHNSALPQPDTFPGLDLRRADMSAYNAPLPPISYRQLAFYRAIRSIPASQLNVHACAHLYASDWNSLFLISNALGIPRAIAKMGSLSHSVVFHVDGAALRFGGDGDGARGWFCQEAWTPRSGGGRGLHETKIWDESGRHIASSWQDGLVRKRLDGDEKTGRSGKL